ncbi:MAG TPA: hypothetical protein VNX65_02720 [Patescibacteria group bacterium]|jgi:hypothetical protein|nr:hypothetical protein [Patescibacteria group bacterium]
MKNYLRDILSYYASGLLIISCLSAGLLVLSPNIARAQTPEQSICEGSNGTWTGGKCVSASKRTIGGTLKALSNGLIFLVGAISVIMVIIGGLRYTLSGGDQAGINSAKNTIIYSLVGVVVSFVSYAIVNFVITTFKIV